MYEGKHIHYSEVDNKPLCSYSIKLCKQRRLKGYAFCIRHVLEDKSAPFKQCEFVAKYNNSRCTNPIPQDQERKYCNSHMQVLGLVPKRAKQKKNVEGTVKNGDGKDAKDSKDEIPSYINKAVPSNLGDMDLIESIINRQKIQEEKINNVSSPEAALHVNSIVAHLLSLPPKKPLGNSHTDTPAGSTADNGKTKVKTKSRNKSDVRSKAQEKFYDKLEQNKVRLHLQRQKEILERAKKLKQPSKSSPFSAKLETLPPFRTFQEQPNTNSQSNLCSSLLKDAKPQNSSKSFHITPAYLPPNVPILQARPKRPRQVFIEKTGVEEVDKLKDIYRAEEHKNLDLFPLGLEDSDEEDSETESGQVPTCHRTSLPSSDEETKRPEISRSELLTQRKSQVRKNCLLALRSETSKREQASERASCLALVEATRQHVAATTKLLLEIKNQLPKREKHRKICHAPDCCYIDEDGKGCAEKGLPFSTHCFKHVVENEHQQLFYQCTGIQSDYTQCKNTAYIIDNERVLCDFHASVLKCQPKPRRPRKKTKPSALTRPFKKKKKKQQKVTRPQKPVPPLEPLGFEMLSSLNLGIDPSQLSPAPDGIDASDISFNLDGHAGLPLDTSDLQIDVDDKDDFANLLPKLQADDLTDIFGVKMFGGKNGDFLPTTEEQEELERALLQASNEVSNAKASLDQFSFAMMSDQESNSSQDEAMNQGDPNELPSDLQAAATRLMEDTLRQNSLNGLNTMQIANSFSSNSFSPNSQGTLATTQAAFNPVPGMLTVPRPMISPAQGKDDLVDTTLLTNGLNQANTSAMLNLQRQFSTDQTMSPHTTVSPHQLLNQHTTQFANQILHSRPINQPQATLLPGQMSASPLDAAASQILMQNFRMPWNALTTNSSLVQPTSPLPFINPTRATMHTALPGFSPTFPSKVSLARHLPDIQDQRMFTPPAVPQNTDQPQANFINPSVIPNTTPMVALSSPSLVPHVSKQGGS
ncbi:INO80 complex subunit D-like isoform X2 [Anneissia japonica]|uniref:INO80 complex subunit D-like isoform X2 n=1 Tax=Anneissia japonica TaxID=1529436 RepID=UPI00142568CD|nr:INO80 complex subunit D-like isoform X2 [Anneissia japonica]